MFPGSRLVTALLPVLTPHLAPLSDEPLPEAEGGGGEDHHNLHQGEGGQVQGPNHDADRLRAGLHEHQPRGLHRIRQVSPDPWVPGY